MIFFCILFLWKEQKLGQICFTSLLPHCDLIYQIRFIQKKGESRIKIKLLKSWRILYILVICIYS